VKLHVICMMCLVVAGSIAFMKPPREGLKSQEQLLAYIRKEAMLFKIKAAYLQAAVEKISPDSSSIAAVKQTLKECRLQYKKISFFLEYFFPSEAQVYNSAPKYEVEEPYMEYQHPKGLQVIEQLLQEKNPDRTALVEQAELVRISAEDIPSLLYRFNASDAQLMESVRLELTRIMTLYVTGYDAPILKSGIEESACALYAIQVALQPYITAENDSLAHSLKATITFLNAHTGFDTFDRLAFLTDFALPLQSQLYHFCRDKQIFLNSVAVVNNEAAGLFDANYLDPYAFTDVKLKPTSVAIILGKTLFAEKVLSGNETRSCESCHSPTNFFVDGLQANKSLDNHSFLARNTPTLLYAGFQYSQFWDGRASSIEAQVHNVLHNPGEMDGNDTAICLKLASNRKYRALFQAAWPGADNSITIEHVAQALSAYINTLAPFNSAFDRYMHGDKKALSLDQQKGFNLFMGKALCGTCHFAPVFNGLVPPYYNRTEYEVAGVTGDDHFDTPTSDTDDGRYKFFPVEFYKGAFKTPSVRNAAATAPYMHHGRFKNLLSVINFYDKGGGAGMGLNISAQTLAATPLHLTEEEKSQLISFIESLNDNTFPGK